MDSELPGRMSVERASRQLRIAVIYSRLPFPMMRGDQLTVAHLLGFLAQRGHKVDLATLSVDGTMSSKQSEWLREQCSDVELFTQSWWSKCLGLARCLLTLRPLQVGLFWNKALEERVDLAIRQGRYDIVYVYYLRSACSIKQRFEPGKTRTFAGRQTAAFLAMQLSQTLNTRRIFEQQKFGPTKLVYWFEWRLLRRTEARIWRRFTHTLLISHKDVEAVRQACKDEGRAELSNWIYGAHGTDVTKFRAANESDRVSDRIVFSGSMHYEPNRQAVCWFVENCWDRIRSRIPDAELLIVGRNPTRDVRALDGHRGIAVTGTVTDVGSYIRSASVCINPMLAAGGMQNKLIEYLASAIPVVATSVANEGIRAPDGTALLIRDDADGFLDAVLMLMRSRERARSLALAGRKFVEDRWSWESHFLELEQNFYRALDRRSNDGDEATT